MLSDVFFWGTQAVKRGTNAILLEKRRIFVTMDVSFHVDAPFTHLLVSKVIVRLVAKGFNRYKVRLVAKSFTQFYGVDYFETFSPVAKLNSITVILSLVANF